MKIVNLFFWFLLCASAGAQIPNNSFSSWTNMGAYTVPDYWDNLNAYTSSSGIYTCIEGDPGNAATNYLIVRTENIPGKGVVTGKAVSGIIDTTTFLPVSGFPFNARPARLDYIVQYMPFDFSDPSNLYVCLTKWNSANNQRDTIARGYSEFLGMAHSWQPLFTDLIYQSGATPDTACIVISSSSVNPLAGGYLYIDDLSFSGNAISVNELETESFLSVFPNPAEDFITVKNINPAEINRLEIFDMTGSLIFSENNNSTYLLDVHMWSPGIYLIRLTQQDNSVNTTKIVIR
ncbi:MAG: T9SS type A sorting domain-containing protein [Bacteroidota bacterium]